MKAQGVGELRRAPGGGLDNDFSALRVQLVPPGQGCWGLPGAVSSRGLRPSLAPRALRAEAPTLLQKARFSLTVEALLPGHLTESSSRFLGHIS